MPGESTQYTLRLGVDTGVGRPEVEALNQSLTRVGQTADRVLQRSERSSRSTDRFSEATGKASRSTAAAARSTDGFTRSSDRLSGSLSRSVKRLAGYAAAYLSIRQAARLATGAVSDFTDIEGGLIGVRKTTDLADDSLSKLYENVVKLSTGPVPLAEKSLLELAEVSGQLGVKGRENLLAYVETLGMMSASTDIIGSKGAQQLARLLNVQNELPKQIRTTGAALVALGNDSAAFESDILRVATEVGLATAQFQIGSVNALALGTALKEVGVEAHAGGTAIGRALREIQKAIFSGGEDLRTFADAAGVSIDQFVAAFEEAPLDAFILLFEGLSKQGQDSAITLDSLGLSSDRLAKVLPSLATNYQTLRKRIEQANEEAAKGTALEIEAGRAFDQTSADLDRLRNAYTAVSAEVGRGMSPAIRELAIETRDWLLANREAAFSLGQDLGEALKTVAGLVRVLVDHADELVAIFQVWVALKVAAWVDAVATSVAKAIAEFQAYSIAAAEASAATAALQSQQVIGNTGTVVDLYAAQLHGQADEIVRTGTVLDLYEDKLYATSVATDTAAASTATMGKQTRFLAAGITPLAIGLGAILGVLLLLNDAVADWGDRMTREIDKIVRGANDFGEAIKTIRDSSRELLDLALQEEEVQNRLLKIGVESGAGDPRELEIRAQVAADFQRRQVDLLSEQRDQLKELRVEEEARAESIERQAARVVDLQREYDKALSRSQAGGEFGAAGAGVGLARAAERLKDARSELEDLELQQERSRIVGTELERSIAALGDATQDYKNTIADVDQDLDVLTEAQKEARQEFARTVSWIDAETAAIERSVDAWSIGSDAVREQTAQLEVENRLKSTGIDLTTEQARALGFESTLREKIARQIAAEQRLSGAQTIAELDRQIASQIRVNEAYVQGAEEVAKARREQELLEAQEQATTGAHKDQTEAIRERVKALADQQAQEEVLRQERDLEDQVRDLEDLASAYDSGLAAGEAMAAVLEVENAIRSETIDLVGTEKDRIESLARERERLQAIVGARQAVGGIEEELRAAKELAQIRRSDYRSEQQYRDAIADVNLEKQIRLTLLALEAQYMAGLTAIKNDETISESERAARIAALNDEFADLSARAVEALREQEALRREMERRTRGTSLEEWAEAAGTLSDALRGVDDDLAAIAGSIQDLIISFQGLMKEGGDLRAITAGLGAVAAVGNAATGGNNYASEGAAFGAIAGAIVGAFVGAPAAGAAVGAGIGQALGSWIGKGSPEFIGSVQDGARGELDSLEWLAEGTLKGVGNQFLQAIASGLQDALDALGGQLESLPTIGVKIRDGVYSVVVGGVKRRFEDMGSAVDFAILEALRQADISGLSPEVRAALENSTAETFQALAEDLDFARWVERLPEIGQLASDSALAVQDAIEQYETALRKAEQLGIQTAKIDQWFGEALKGVRNQLLGIQETNAERISREAEGFNRQLELYKAELQLRKIDLEQQRADLLAKSVLVQLGIDLSRIRTEAEYQELIARTNIGEAYIAEMQRQLEQLAAIDEALLALQANIDLIPDLMISDAEIQDAISRAGSGAAQQRQQERDQIEAELRDLHDLARGLPESATRLRTEFESFDDWIDKARELGFAEERLAEARRDRAEIETADLLEPFVETIREAASSSELETELRSIGERYAEELTKALIIAEERAAALGTTVAEELDGLAPIIAQALGVEAADAIADQLLSAVESGDLEAIQALGSALESLPAEVAAEALAELARRGGELREALLEVRDAILESVQEYLDAAQGIGEYERRLIDLQETFREAREGLDAVEAGLDFLATPPEIGEEGRDGGGLSDGVRDAIDAMEREAIDAFEGIADAIREIFGAGGRGSIGGDIQAIRRPSSHGGGSAGDITDERLRAVEQAMAGVSRASRELEDDFASLEDAERRAIQSLGVEFLQSLDTLGASLPTDVTFELARAQFELARAEAISSALALAAAGAFQGLSISIGDILDIIASADFESSQFAPGGSASASAASRASADRADQDLARLLGRMDQQIRTWLSLDLGPLTQDAIDLRRTMVELEQEAERLGASTEELSAAYAVARQSFIDRALEPFESLDSSPLERELDGLIDQFIDLATAFEVIGASQDEWVRLQEAFNAALDDFWTRATAGIRSLIDELEASDPRRSLTQQFVGAQADFRSLLAAAQGGDLEALSKIESAARLYQDQALAFLGGGVGSQEVLDELLTGLGLVADAGIVPEDIRLLRDQLDQLERLLEVAESQPTQGSNSSGFSGIRSAIEGDREVTASLLDQILQAIANGELSVPGIGDVLQTLADMVGVLDLSQDDLQRIFESVSGVVDVADTLGPSQLSSLVNLVASLSAVETLTDDQRGQLAGMIDTLLGLETLTDAQRAILQGLSGETSDQGGTLEGIWGKMDENLRQLKAQGAFTEPLLRSINVRSGESRTALYDIRTLLSNITQLETGGRTLTNGLAFLHAGELVLNPGQTNTFERLVRDLAGSSRLGAPFDQTILQAFRSTLPRERLVERPLRISPERQSIGSTGPASETAGTSREVQAVRQVLERGEARRSQSEEAAAELAVARLRQGTGTMELLAAMASEIAQLRDDLAARMTPGGVGRSK